MDSETARRFPMQFLFTDPGGAEPCREFKVASDENIRIAVTLLTFIGETVLTLPSLTALRQAFPRAHIVAITLNSNAELLQGHPAVDDVHICDLGSYDLDSAFPARSYICLAGLTRWITQQSFHIGVEITPTTKWLFRFAGVATIIEYPLDGLSILRANRELSPTNPHAVDRYLGLVEKLGATAVGRRSHLVLDSRAKEFADRLLFVANSRRHKLLVGVHFGASARAKQWSPAGFAQLCNTIAEEHQAQMLFVGGKREIELATQIARKMHQPPVVATGIASLKQTCARIDRCHLFISNDSGPLHLAAALRVPLVGIYGPTDHRVWGPQTNAGVIVRRALPCSPCWRDPTEIPLMQQLRLRLKRPAACIDSITVNDVSKAVDMMLENVHQRKSILHC